MTNEDLVGRCGLYCGACSIYRAYKDNGEYLKRIATRFKCSPEKVRCEGCQILTPEFWGNDCKIVQCSGLGNMNSVTNAQNTKNVLAKNLKNLQKDT